MQDNINSVQVELTPSKTDLKKIILNEVLSAFLKTFSSQSPSKKYFAFLEKLSPQSQDEVYLAFIEKISFEEKQEFLKLLFNKLFINNDSNKFSTFAQELRIQKNDLSLYIRSSNLYNFTLQTIQLFQYINISLGLDFKWKILSSWRSTYFIQKRNNRYKNIEKDIDQYFGYNEPTTDAEIDKIYNSKNLFSEINSKMQKIYQKHKTDIDKIL